MSTFHDSGRALLRTVWSSVGVVFLCPFVLRSYGPAVGWIWADGSHPGMDINEPVGLFLTPAGLVYALMFASMYESALTKWKETSALFFEEVGCKKRSPSSFSPNFLLRNTINLSRQARDEHSIKLKSMCVLRRLPTCSAC
jgi:hypothetical protein